MKSSEIASLGLKLAGIYALLHALSPLQYLLTILGSFQQMYMFAPLAVSSLLSMALMVGLGIALLRHSDRWGVRLVGAAPSAESGVSGPLSGPELQAIAFSVVGVGCVVAAVGRLVAAGVAFALPIVHAPVTAWPALLGALVELIAGIGLFMNARKLAAFWHSRKEPTS